MAAANATAIAHAPPVAARIALLYSGSYVGAEHGIRVLINHTGEHLAQIVEGQGAFDMGRLLHALDLLQQAKNVAHDALALPKLVPKQ